MKHYASNCFQFSKNTKIKIDVNVVETTKKQKFLKKNSQIFKNNKRIKSESNFVYETTITNDDEKNYSTKISLNDVVKINVINQRFVVVLNFQFIDNKLSVSHFINK